MNIPINKNRKKIQELFWKISNDFGYCGDAAWYLNKKQLDKLLNITVRNLNKVIKISEKLD